MLTLKINLRFLFKCLFGDLVFHKAIWTIIDILYP